MLYVSQGFLSTINSGKLLVLAFVTVKSLSQNTAHNGRIIENKHTQKDETPCLDVSSNNCALCCDLRVPWTCLSLVYVSDQHLDGWVWLALVLSIILHLLRPQKINNTLRPRQNGRRFADDTFKRIFLNENVRISFKISLKFVPMDPINNNSALV